MSPKEHLSQRKADIWRVNCRKSWRFIPWHSVPKRQLCHKRTLWEQWLRQKGKRRSVTSVSLCIPRCITGEGSRHHKGSDECAGPDQSSAVNLHGSDSRNDDWILGLVWNWSASSSAFSSSSSSFSLSLPPSLVLLPPVLLLKMRDWETERIPLDLC